MIIEVKSRDVIYKELIECADIFIYKDCIIKYKDSINLESLSSSKVETDIQKDYLITVLVKGDTYYIKTDVDNKSKVLAAINRISRYDFKIYKHLHLYMNDSVILDSYQTLINP